ncbi:hypothetical protein AKI39_12815 [Bordetella sp. H567]|uniref:cupredoxin domain-containing protein n=1 Tax=Bordetella sp. H567 TaxID=1697043 RepID=UPI00081D009D|nr:cupredoxin family copper-binding protein [Bordetella sp. H567]AOB31379.1 hypothetical protein AKI39_12815 [Bordetella sp. H567]
MAEPRIPARRTPARAWLLASLLALVWTLLPRSALAHDDGHATATTHVVTLEGMQFVPATLEAKPGERIEWVNKDLVPHTVTSTFGAFDSHSIAPGASWTYTADKPGSYPYTCQFHPGMLGTVVVR